MQETPLNLLLLPTSRLPITPPHTRVSTTHLPPTGEEVKAAVREVVQQVLPVLLAACGCGGGGGGGDMIQHQQQQQHGEVYAWEQLQVRHRCVW